MAFVVDTAAQGTGARAQAPHPLAPLTAAEIETASAAVKAAKGLANDTARFVYISLYEPPKPDIIAFEQGAPAPDRLAKIVLRESAERATYEAVVRLPSGGAAGAAGGAEVIEFKRVPGVQPSVMLEEFLASEDIVRKDPRWQEAMRKRGIEDFDLCMIDPWSTPNVEQGVGPTDGRFVSPLTWIRSDPDDNGYAHPVEGVVTLVDLDTLTVIKVDDYGVVPVPKKSANYTTARISDPENVPYFPAGPRTDVKPFDITQHEGPSFTIEGHHLSWQKWDLRIGFTAREGLVLHAINYDHRSIIHRASLSEMFVPYGDPGRTQYRKLVLDEGEYGIGLLTNALELGCDCLGEIAYLDGVVNDNDGHPLVMPNAICLHEEDHGIAWKHTDFRTGHAEVRRMRRMVISSIVTVGNYEYGYYWYLYQDGSIEYEVKLSGVISNGAIEEGVKPEFGTIVAPGLYGPNHQHFFNVRLDMAVDGAANSVYEVTPTAMPEGPDNPVGNAWRAEEVLIEDETMARRDADPLAGRYWKIVNENVKNALGQPVAYKLIPEHTIKAFAHPGSAVERRAGFITNPLWVTAYDKDELFATGNYPNQSTGGAGLPTFVTSERNLTDTDVVLWFTFGTNHVVRPEDWPVMPVHPIGFRLLPAGFFVGNPSLDNPQPGGDHCHHH
jgi:primary-amine oxidase